MLKLTYSNLEYSKFSGGGPRTPSSRGGEGREGKGKGRREKDREGTGEEWGRVVGMGEEGSMIEGPSTWAPPPRDKLWIRPLSAAGRKFLAPPCSQRAVFASLRALFIQFFEPHYRYKIPMETPITGNVKYTGW